MPQYSSRKLSPGDSEYEANRAEVLAEDHAERTAYANSPEGQEAERRARAIELYGYDPMEELRAEEGFDEDASRWSSGLIEGS